ncbi:hypothetical protein chiPu_0022661 [Chiloscyllium punctatum]|uniref:Uncharacterized protein n=1 Tax=Chiloscyllium punctatum TaxID=137246 RepID=A0A401RJF6_CHIPU|nr:hypothetical protein [Chiloscyllium punctatum]
MDGRHRRRSNRAPPAVNPPWPRPSPTPSMTNRLRRHDPRAPVVPPSGSLTPPTGLPNHAPSRRRISAHLIPPPHNPAGFGAARGDAGHGWREWESVT